MDCGGLMLIMLSTGVSKDACVCSYPVADYPPEAVERQ